MSAVSEGSVLELKRAFDGEATPSANRRKTPSPLTLRLTIDERAKLEELAAGMTLSAYVRACVFAEETERRKRRPKDVIEDKKAVAEALALLGQSRTASSLNQLAHHANFRILNVGDEEKAQIKEANTHLEAFGVFLYRPSGQTDDPGRQCARLWAELARQLLNPRDNDHVTVYAIEGLIADDLADAFSEAEAISQATQC